MRQLVAAGQASDKTPFPDLFAALPMVSAGSRKGRRRPAIVDPVAARGAGALASTGLWSWPIACAPLRRNLTFVDLWRTNINNKIDTVGAPGGNVTPLLKSTGPKKSPGGFAPTRGARFEPGAAALRALRDDGTGKSTFLSVEMRIYLADAGKIRRDSREVERAIGADAPAPGVVLIEKELSPTPQTTVAETCSSVASRLAGSAGRTSASSS